MIAAPSMIDELSRLTGLDLSEYRDQHVADRIRQMVERERLADGDDLVSLLRCDEKARLRFRRAVGVSFSGLFRDPAQFDLLENQLLPPILDANPWPRVWSAGCANGSELYSVAIVLDRLGALERSRLLGSDLLEENLDAARRGVYGDVTISERLRARTQWERRDLVRQGSPTGSWDLVLCRNVAIYLAPGAKRALHDTLASALAPGGVLLLGRSERLTDARRLGLERVAAHAYRRI